MKNEIIIAGFGGQGILALGQMLVYGGMSEGKEVSWFPSYGPEMRGGTANCSIVISNHQISSPVVNRPDILIACNKPSLEKFIGKVKKGGIIIYNSSLILSLEKQQNIAYYGVPANKIAEEAGNVKAANVVLGEVLLALTKIISEDAFTFGIEKILPPKPALLELNHKARQEARLFLENSKKQPIAG